MKKIKRIVYPICLILLIIAIWNLWKIKSSTVHTEHLYNKLAQEQSSQLQLLYKQNHDLVGWLKIKGTVIDYPVMQTKIDNDYYLTHDFERKENVHGTPFLDVNCHLNTSDNLIIYGHHMKDGTMFQNLMKYKDPAFCQSHRDIQFQTLNTKHTYHIIFVFVVSKEETKKFPYYNYIDLSHNNNYQQFLDYCSRYAIYKANNLPTEGTKLLTLSTCEYTKNDGRLVVVAADH
ncbi:MAG: class B sortase [Sharpea porci]|uniref:class B sortase n=1 Tax=Sharpea porci TaxID=2652286 RepID=UPI00240A2067|nr:class B sortase [Sharpea porci]MDD6711857.1 class B sortase [Sharpea porci]